MRIPLHITETWGDLLAFDPSMSHLLHSYSCAQKQSTKNGNETMNHRQADHQSHWSTANLPLWWTWTNRAAIAPWNWYNLSARLHLDLFPSVSWITQPNSNFDTWLKQVTSSNHRTSTCYIIQPTTMPCTYRPADSSVDVSSREAGLTSCTALESTCKERPSDFNKTSENSWVDVVEELSRSSRRKYV